MLKKNHILLVLIAFQVQFESFLSSHFVKLDAILLISRIWLGLYTPGHLKNIRYLNFHLKSK